VTPVEVVLYGAPGCHLCEVAKDQLASQRDVIGFELRVVDISADPELEAAFRPEIPVVFVGGRKAFKYRVDLAELRRRVLAMSQSGP
jgi:glutaredoxin